MYITYRESKSGGEVCEGQEDNCYPCYEDEFIEWSLTGCYKAKPSWYYESVPDLPISAGDPVYVVYVRYTTGCTFGRTLGAWKILGAYATYEEAEKVKESVDNDTYGEYPVWKGYFESLEKCEIEKLSLI